MKYKIVGQIPNEWSDTIESGFDTEQSAEAEIARIKSGVSGMDYEAFEKKDGSLWIVEDIDD